MEERVKRPYHKRSPRWNKTATPEKLATQTQYWSISKNRTGISGRL